MQSIRTLLRASSRAPASAARLTTNTTSIRLARPIHQSAALQLPYKDDQDRNSLKPRAHEYTGSGTDEGTAANEDAAFNPDKTSPEAAKETAGKGNDTNPLEVSPANPDTAKAGRGKEDDRPHGGQSKASRGGDAPKAGKV
ncbi:Uu.00g122540.m01.CDS01 [Anthostomella pinea]|uniref:Uu.00g122540.m01.CDS01 n=1 Tax=Anthostomella pinea TaxID=933095 RepID=A0AAI8YHB4_9PEZI|nr:Uu.00g122540.m01.CDS01 [Anthostomella pinea]